MSALFAIALLAGLDATPTPTPALPSVGVFVVGEDAAAGGALQKDLERMISATPGITVRAANALAPKLAVPRAPAAPQDPATKAEAAKLLDDAKAAYYDDASAQALDRLAKLEDLQARVGGFAPIARIEMRLWRVAVFLALKDEQQASDEALAALSIDPELKIDLKELPPSVLDEVEKARKTRLKIFTVIVSGLPPVADVSVDGRSVPSRFRAAAGHHRLIASSPGRQEVVREIDTVGDMSVSLPLPLLPPPDAEKALADIAWPAAPSPGAPTVSSDAAPLGALASRLGVNWLVLVSLRAAGAKPVLVGAAASAPAFVGDAVAPGPQMSQQLADSISPALTRVLRPAKVARGPSAPGAPGWHFAPRGALAIAARYRTLAGGSSDVKTLFAGTGPIVGVDAVNGATTATAEVAWTTWSPSTLEVRLPDGSTRSANGGSTSALAVGVGRRRALSADGFDDGLTLRYGLRLLAENHDASDVTTKSGGKLGLLASWTRIAPELRVGARFPLHSQPIALEGDLGLSPVGYWSDRPAKVYGGSATATPAFSWRAGATWNARGLALSLLWNGESFGASHKGTAQVPANPPLRSTKISETVQSITAGVSKSF